MSTYFDTSVVTALFTEDPHAERADQFMAQAVPTALVSDLAAAEFAAVVARLERMRVLTRARARDAFDRFDTWLRGAANRVTIAAADVTAAERQLRTMTLTLRAADAIHIAAARRMEA